MTVTLTPELEASLQRRVDTGRYDSASDVVHEALRLLDELDRLRGGQDEEIRRKISAGMDSLRAGRSIDGEEYFNRLDEELSAIDESEAS
jgi:antitoxin ParD1/3/4